MADDREALLNSVQDIQDLPTVEQTGTPDILKQTSTGWTPFFLTPVDQNPAFNGSSFASQTTGPTATSDRGWFLTGIPSIEEDNQQTPTDVTTEVQNQTEQAAHPLIKTTELDKNSGISDSYYSSIAQHESGNSNTAANPNSSALGKYQFLSGTWKGLMQSHPELGLTANGRTDPEQQELAIRAFTKDNEKQLLASNIPINNGSLYAAHFLGASEASKVWNTDPTTPMTDLVSPAVAKVNSFLRHMDVGQFKLWATKAGGG